MVMHEIRTSTCLLHLQVSLLVFKDYIMQYSILSEMAQKTVISYGNAGLVRSGLRNSHLLESRCIRLIRVGVRSLGT